MKILTRYLRQFAAWVTGLTDKYRINPYFKATVNIVVIQCILAVLLIGITSWSIEYAQSHTAGSVARHITLAQQVGSSSINSIPEALARVRTKILTYVILSLIVLIALFGYLIIRFALLPNKNSLRFQKRFIGNLAHELRTPLAIIKTSTEVALMDPTLSKDQIETFKGTVTELDRMSEIINSLLSFDLLLQPGQIKNELVDLGSIVDKVVTSHQALAESRGITFSVLMSNKRVVMGNPTSLEQLVTNLVENALNYTPANGNGTVRVNIENDHRKRIVLAVIDSGIGISEKDLYHIFEPYYRGDTSRARDIGTGNSGLGLAIVNEIVRLHKGSISVKSALMNGSTFAISFPSAPEDTILENPLLSSLEDGGGINEVAMDFS
jgi:signal transduction histidine kinase